MVALPAFVELECVSLDTPYTRRQLDETRVTAIGERDFVASGVGIWLQHSLHLGDVILDVGANIGAYSELAAILVGSSGRVVAIEPAPENVVRLRARLRDYPQVSIVAAAAGETTGAATLFLDRRDDARHSLAESNVGKPGETITVQQITLDDLSDLRRLDVLKVDAQGAELRILYGARRLLTRFHPRLVVELWPCGLSNFGCVAADVLTEMHGYGYRIHRLSSKGRLKDIRHVHDFLKTATRWNCINIVGV